MKEVNMDKPSPFCLVVALILFVISCFIYSILQRRHGSSKIPPGPFQFPIVGNVFQLTGTFHRTLAKLSQTYGPLMAMKLLNKTIIVISSPKLAKELFQKYDHTFTNRLVLDAFRALDHHKFSILFLPAETEWRNLRKLLKEQVFSSERLTASQELRQAKVQQLCDYVHEFCSNGQTVDIGVVTFTTVMNFLSNTIFSVDLAHYDDSNASHELKEIIRGVVKNLSKLNLADLFPVLQGIDPQGLRRQNKFYLGKIFETFDHIISQRLREKDQSINYVGKNDLLEVLLDWCQSQQREADQWSYNDIKHLILDLFLGGMDSPSATIEWAMAELLRNPEKMKKLAAEIREVIGPRKMIQESDISMLPYLQAVVKETLRLHPIASVTGRNPKDDIEIDQYIVPKNAEIFLNIWAINRDSSAWSNPDSFVPERFLDCKIDAKGQHFEFLPFGAGRRMCPGVPLAYRMVHLMLASLLQNFDWKLEDEMNPENIDMTETSGFVVHKALPIKAIPITAKF